MRKEAKSNGALRKKLSLFSLSQRTKREIAFEVYVNKVLVCTTGLDEFQHIGASLFSFTDPDGPPPAERKIYFSVYGRKDKKMYRWVQYKLRKGHRVEIRIVDAKKTDEPKEMRCSGGSCGVQIDAPDF